MAMKKKGPFNESEKARRSARIAFVDKKVGEKGITRAQARQRNYVQTRIAEMKAKGKTVTPEMRKQLQQKFQSGDVSRRGFAAPKKKTGGSGSSSPVVRKATPRTDSGGRSGFGATAPRSMPSANDREGRGGPKYGKPASRTDSMGRSGFGSTRTASGTAATRMNSKGSGYGGVSAPLSKSYKKNSVSGADYLKQQRIKKMNSK